MVQEVGDDGAADLERRDVGGQDALGAVGEVLQVEGREPDDLGHRDGGQHEVGAAQPEADAADDQATTSATTSAGPHPVPGRDLPALHQDHGRVGADAEVGGVADRVLAGVAAEDVPALPHDDAEEEQDHDVERVGALHEFGNRASPARMSRARSTLQRRIPLWRLT